MKSHKEIVKMLEESLSVHSINEIPELQNFKSYDDIKDKHNKRELLFGLQLQENVVANFGSTGEVLLDKLLLLSPFVMILLSIIFSIYQEHYYLLFGIPLSILGLILTSPSIMKQGSSFLGIVMITLLIFGIYSAFNDFSTGFLLLCYSVPNFLLTVNRQLNMQVFEKAILSSEIVFIYYFLRGECNIKNTKEGTVIYKN